ncbi:MAG: NAD(P)H-hydrate dehydratase [Gammaproteobacteria bacterium]|nr:NAD(P)H-hydrate dehydratase [Gammaproteobacteria bacterium]
MTELPQSLFGAAQTRELDRLAIEDCGIAGASLMTTAGEAAFACVRRKWPQAKHITVVCGGGNNGGDGYVVAHAAKSAGMDCCVLALAEPRSDDAKQMRRMVETDGIAVESFDAQLPSTDVIVDGLFGTGLERAVSGQWARAIEAINAATAPVLALDIPSGIHADTGRVLGSAVRADLTVTFIGLKLGLFTGRGPEFVGEIRFENLGVPSQIYDVVSPLAVRVTPQSLCRLVPRRARDAHKGHAGHVLVVGGDLGMPGAVRMAGAAAYRSGAGLVTVATQAAHAELVTAYTPELMVAAVDDCEALRQCAERCSAIAVGPGLGRNAWGQAMFAAATELNRPLVVDADALNLLADNPFSRDNWVLTPHPGEAARLLGSSTADVQADRRAAACAIIERYGGVCVLKGAGTLIASSSDNVYLCDRGNPGMASGGMGDVLSGVIIALIAQGLGLAEAARLGAWIHASAGDRGAQQGGELGLMATDLLRHIRAELNDLAALSR